MSGQTPGRLYAVGLGPGDPELLTVKAVRLIRQADVVAYFSGTHGRSIARGIAEGLLGTQQEELLRYPVTTGPSEHPDGYYAQIDEFYDQSAHRLAGHLEAGRSVVVLAEGDPLFYGSWMYLQQRLSGRFPTEVVAGVTSISGASAAMTGQTGFSGLTFHEDVLTVLPGTLPVPELARRLADTDAAVVMKLGRTFPGVVEALHQAGRLDRAWLVERASWPEQQITPVREVDPATVPYFSVVVVAGEDRRADAAGRHQQFPQSPPGLENPTIAPPRSSKDAVASRRFSENADPSRWLSEGGTTESKPHTARLLVIGLGPGPAHWLTPEASAALAEVQHVFGYGPYVDRIPQRAGLTRHASGNTVEVDRAREALDLALSGASVAMVSGGDAGVFGMASAVFEAAQDPAYRQVEVTVLPGLTAAQAVAARAGAPLGGDFAVLSLSDRLKPWPVIEQRLRLVAAADLVIALYNPRSRSRPHQLGDALAVLREIRGGETIVVIGRHIGRPGEELRVSTLSELDPESIDMACLVMIGASGTRVDAGRVWTPRFVPDQTADSPDPE